MCSFQNRSSITQTKVKRNIGTYVKINPECLHAVYAQDKHLSVLEMDQFERQTRDSAQERISGSSRKI